MFKGCFAFVACFCKAGLVRGTLRRSVLDQWHVTLCTERERGCLFHQSAIYKVSFPNVQSCFLPIVVLL